MSRYNHFDDHVRYEQYDEEAQQRYRTRQQRRKPKPRQAVQHTTEQLMAELADQLEIESGFEFSYTTSLHEAGWVLDALKSFYQEALITDVLALVKGGKEANVYQCRAHASLGVEFVAAKVYRPKVFRTIRNDAVYREARAVLGADEVEITARDKRAMKALAQKSSTGDRIAHQSWLMHEYSTLALLHEAGAAVPQPHAVAPNAILMQFIGDADGAAPVLHSVNLRQRLVKPAIHALWRQVVATIELLLSHNRIHGDLSAYNILYWQEGVTLIDFPQVVVAKENSNARAILTRDVQRVGDYFLRQGLDIRPQAVADKLWYTYVGDTPPYEDPDFAADERESGRWGVR